MTCVSQTEGHDPSKAVVRAGWEACPQQAPVEASMNKYMKFSSETLSGERTKFDDDSIDGAQEMALALLGKIDANGDLVMNVDAENHAILFAQAMRSGTVTNPTSGVYLHKLALGETTTYPESISMEVYRDSLETGDVGFVQQFRGGRVAKLVLSLSVDGILTATISLVFERYDYLGTPLGPVATGRIHFRGLPRYDNTVNLWDKSIDGDILVKVSDVSNLPTSIDVVAKRAKKALLTGTATVSAGQGATAGEFVGTGTLFTSELAPGDQIDINSESVVVASIEDDTNLTLVGDHSAGASGDAMTIEYGSTTSTITIGTDNDGKGVYNTIKRSSDGSHLGDEAVPFQMHMDDGTGTVVSRSLTGTVSVTAGQGAEAGEFVGVGTAFLTELVVGGEITVASETHVIASIEDNTNLTLETDHVAGAAGAAATAATVWVVPRNRAVWTPSFADVPVFNEIFAAILVDGTAFRVNQFTLTHTIPVTPDKNIGGAFPDGILTRGLRTTELSMERRYVDNDMRKRLERAKTFSFRMDAKSGDEFVAGHQHTLSAISPKMILGGRTANVSSKEEYNESITATGHPDATNVSYPKALTIELKNSIADLSA